MNIWQRLFTKPENLAENGFALAVTDKTKKQDENSYWVALAVHKIAQTITSVPTGFYTLDKEGNIIEVGDNNIVKRVFKKPDGKLTFRQWLKKLVGLYILKGGVYIFIDDKNKDDVRYQIFTEYDPKTKTATIEGEQLKVKEDKIITFIDPDFNPETTNFNITKKIESWITADFNLNNLFERVSRNGSTTGGVVKTPLTKQTELEKFKEMWKEHYEGWKKNIIDIILPKGYEYELQGTAPKDVNLPALLDKSQKRILMAFGIPESMLGVVDGKGRANIEGAYYGFMAFTIKPILEELYELFNEHIIPDLDENTFFDYDDPVPQDKLNDAQVHRMELGGKAWKTPNEVRAELGLEPLEGNDELNPSPLDQILNQEQNRLAKVRIPRRILRKQLIAKRSNNLKEVAKQLATLTEKAESNKIEFSEAELKYIDEKGEKRAVVLLKYVDRLKELLQPRLKKQGEEMITDLLEGRKVRSVNWEDDAEFLALVKELITTEAEARYRELDLDSEFIYTDKIKKGALELWAFNQGSWSETTKKKLVEKAKEAIEQGIPRDELAKELGKIVKDRTEEGLTVLAHDTVFTLSNYASNEAFKQSRVVKRKIWVAVGDERTCAQCGAMHGKVVSVEEKFLDAGQEFIGLDGKTYKASRRMEFPAMHPFCRCDVMTDIEVERLRSGMV